MAETRRLTAVIEREGDGYVALCPQLDVASQGHTIEEARANLIEAVSLFFEAAEDSEIERRFQPDVFITQIEVPVGWAAAALRRSNVSHSRSAWLVRVRQRGSNVVMQKRTAETTATVPVPLHPELRRGTLQSIIRQSGIPRSAFEYSE